MINTKRILCFILLLSLPGSVMLAQSYRSMVNDANTSYSGQQYDKARDGYTRATVENPDRIEAWFNHGNAAYRSDDVQAALKKYEAAALRARNKKEVATTLYNAGNVFLNAAEKGLENAALQQAGQDANALRMEGYRQAIEMYKQSLKLNPKDDDARYNLTYARKKLEEMQQQQQQQNQQDQQKQDQKQDKEQDQQQQDKSKQQDQQKQEQQDQQQQQEQNQKDQQQQQQARPEQQQRQPQMSRQQAEQILRALERQEKELQKEKRKQTPVRISVDKDW
jgi:Ca-activated chloride channel homolog